MRNVMDACKKHGARLVFFDNAYRYVDRLRVMIVRPADFYWTRALTSFFALSSFGAPESWQIATVVWKPRRFTSSASPPI